MTFRPNSTPSAVSYAMPRRTQRVGEAHHAEADAADALGERVDLRSGYLLTSMMLSRKCVQRWMSARNASQSIWPSFT